MNPTEKLLNKNELLAALAEVLPEPPCSKTINLWLALEKFPMPSIPKPGSGKGTGKRTHRWFRLSAVLAWLDNPAEFYAQLSTKRKAG